jgi:hypothetical protein
MALEITVLTGATLTATVEGNAILASIIASSATLEINMGTPGPAATVQVGTTTTGIPGTDASVTNSGTTSAAILNFTIPRGDKGEQGNPGTSGTSATVDAGTTTTLEPGSDATVENVGTTSNAIFNFGIPAGVRGEQGERGYQGDKGDQGDAAVINVGTTSTLSAGSPATVTNSGTTQNAVFNFGIPQGYQGVKGDTGSQGEPGVGVPAGGTFGQGLIKTSNTFDYETGWAGPFVSLVDTNLQGMAGTLQVQGLDLDGNNISNVETIQVATVNVTYGTSPKIHFGSGDQITPWIEAPSDGEIYGRKDGSWSTIPSGGGGTWGSITGTLSNQTDLQSALDAKLSLTGGSMSGDIIWPAVGTGSDSQIGTFGFGTENVTLGQTAYVEPQQIRIYDGTHLIGTSLNGTGITFNDETVQVTAGLPLTGGTMTGTINGYAWQNNPFSVTEFWDGNPSNPESGRIATAYIESDGFRGAIKLQGEDGPNIGLYATPSVSYIQFGDSTQQTTAFIPADWLSTSAAYSTFLTQSNASSTYLTQSSAASTYFPKPTGTTSQYITGTGSLVTFPPLGDRYLTSSTSTLTCDSGNGKTMTVGTGLSYSRQQDITVSYDNANHMHGTVLTYNSTTGVMTFDSNTHSGGGTYSSWEVNVGGVAGAVLPVGGTAGQVLAKINSTNFNTEWVSLGSASTLASSAVLQTANNLSDLSSSSTARTNLGLGSMATQSTSAYLSTAAAASTYLSISSAASTYQTQAGMSAYLSTSAAASTYQTQAGMSAYLSTSAAASTYQTQSGMSAYLSTASASANFIGTSAYATTVQAQAGTSTTTVINPSTLLDAKFFSGGKFINAIAWSTATSGVGASASAQSMNGRVVIAPTSATGYGQNLGTIVNNSRGGAYTAGIDWSKRVIFGGRFSRNVTTPDTASVFRFGLGRFSGQAPSDIVSTDKQVGIKVSGSGAIVLYVANGSALTTTTSSFTPSNLSAYDVVIVSDGSGNVTLYVNGSSVATSTGGPTSSQGANYNVITFEAQNSTTLTNGAMVVIGSDFFAQVNS